MSELQRKKDIFRAMSAARQNGGVAPIEVAEPQSGQGANVIAMPETGKASAVDQLKQIKQETRQSTPDAATRTAETLKAVQGQLRPFEDLNGNFFVSMMAGDRQAFVPLGSQLAEDLIRSLVYEQSGKMIGKDGIESSRSMLRMVARANGKKAVFLRVGTDGDGYLIDLNNRTGQVGRVTGSGVSVERNEAVAFIRPTGLGELPVPTLFNSAQAAWEALGPLLENIPEADHVPLVAALVEFLRCDTPYPVPIFIGAEGSGKTIAAQRFIWTADPPGSNQTPSTRFDVKDIVASAQSRHVILIDNAQGPAPRGVEDILCPRSTGGSLSERALYTNANSVTHNLHGGTVITGIAIPVRQADMLDRCLVIHVQKPKRYRPTSEILANYREKLPDVFGAALFFLNESIKRYDEIAGQRVFKIRLVEWAMTGEAIMQALGGTPGAFVELLDVKRQRAAEDYIEGDTFARALVKALNSWGSDAKPGDKLPGWRQWATEPGWSATEVQGRVIVAATAQGICSVIARHCDDWTTRHTALPTTARATTGALQRVQGVLGRAGIEASLRPINGGKNNAWVFMLPARDKG